MKKFLIVTAFSIALATTLTLSLGASSATPAPAAEENWPQWRGPHLNGTSGETGLPTSWGEDENVLWKVPMGTWTGATPIIWEDDIFMMVSYVQRASERRGRGRAPAADSSGPSDAATLADITGSESRHRTPAQDQLNVELWRLNRLSGEIIWKEFLSSNDHQERKQNMSSPSPVTDGTHIWTMTGTGWLRAMDFDGEELWSRNISDDYYSFGLNWGFASSPLLLEDSLYIQVLHGMKTDEPSYLLRVDKMTGETRWMVERPTEAIRESPDSYTTPALLEYDGRRELVITGGDVVTGHDLDTGEELWRADGLNPENRANYRIVASPLIIDDVIIAPTRVRPMLALQAGGRGDVTTSNLLWSFDSGPDVPSPVSDGELLYIVDDGGRMHVLEVATGEVVYSNRIEPGTYSASPILADGKIYATSEDGITTVVRAGRDFEILATNTLEGYTLSTPAIAYGHLYMRVGEHLYAIGSGANDN